MMSQKILVSDPINHPWAQQQTYDTDTMTENHHELSANSSVELPSSFNVDVFYTKVQNCRYLCGACGENVLENEISEHHASEHGSAPFIIEMYELFEVDECFKCDICGADQLEGDLKKHLIDTHRDELISQYFVGEPIQFSAPWSTSVLPTAPPMPLGPLQPVRAAPLPPLPLKPSIEPETATIPGNFMCLACGIRNLHQKNLDKHRKKLHDNISYHVNIFAQQPDRHKVRCVLCEKWMFQKNLDKHCKMYHPYATDVPGDDGFVNIRISNTEFQRMQTQNRIYERNGVQYLKDSE